MYAVIFLNIIFQYPIVKNNKRESCGNRWEGENNCRHLLGNQGFRAGPQSEGLNQKIRRQNRERM